MGRSCVSRTPIHLRNRGRKCSSPRQTHKEDRRTRRTHTFRYRDQTARTPNEQGLLLQSVPLPCRQSGRGSRERRHGVSSDLRRLQPRAARHCPEPWGRARHASFVTSAQVAWASPQATAITHARRFRACRRGIELSVHGGRLLQQDRASWRLAIPADSAVLHASGIGGHSVPYNLEIPRSSAVPSGCPRV